VLLSGGSSNIRWVVNLLQRDVGERLGDATVLELQENFQEIVAKGLAIECARRTFNAGDSEFRSVTYNRLCMGLDPDGRGYGTPRYKPITEMLPESQEDGVLLPSSSALQGFIGKAMSWKFRLKHPPKQYLDYYFMRSSLDPSEATELHNVIDHRIQTPTNAGFDGQVYVELKVREDGTTVPKFIYRRAGPVRRRLRLRAGRFYGHDVRLTRVGWRGVSGV